MEAKIDLLAEQSFRSSIARCAIREKLSHATSEPYLSTESGSTRPADPAPDSNYSVRNDEV